MSKGLEELNKIKKLDILYDIEMTENGEEYMKDENIDLSIIENELEEYQLHEEILNNYGLTLVNFREACLLLAQWKGSGLCWADYERQKTALDIIKSKRISLEYIKCCETYEQYKTICSYWNEIDQEEFNLLKEVLNNGR